MLLHRRAPAWAPAASFGSHAPFAAGGRRCRRHTSAPRATDSEDPSSSLGSGLPAALAERMARLRALEEYGSLLQRSDVLAPATAVAPSLPAARNQTAATAAAEAEAETSPQQMFEQQTTPIDLIQATMLIARHARPHLDATACEAELARLAQSAEARLTAAGVTAARYPLRLVKEVNMVLYGENGYKGNEVDYYSPDNSHIDQVLAKRRGIPISLSLVYMAVAARVGLTMEPVNLPAHLMLRPVVRRRRDGSSSGGGGGGDSAAGTAAAQQEPTAAAAAAAAAEGPGGGGEQGEKEAAARQEGSTGSGEGEKEEEEEEDSGPGLLVDAFHGGELCWLQDAEERLSGITGMRVVLDPRWASGEAPAMSGGTFLLRWLNNLRQVYVLANRAEDALATLRYMRYTLEAMQQQAAARAASNSPAAAAGPPPSHRP